MQVVLPKVVVDTNTLSGVKIHGILVTGDGTNAGVVTLKYTNDSGAVLGVIQVASTGSFLFNPDFKFTIETLYFNIVGTPTVTVFYNK